MEDAPGDFRQDEGINSLLLELLDPVRRAHGMPLQFEIDSHRLAASAWGNFLRHYPEPDIDQVLRVFERQLAAALGIDRKRIATLRADIPDDLVAGTAGWFDLFFRKLRVIDPIALEITGLLLEGFDERSIAEKTETGLRLVKRIVDDIRTHLTKADSEGSTTC